MEARIEKHEEFVLEARDRLTRIETRLDQTATRADVHQGIAEVVRWMVGIAIVLGATAVTVMTFVLNNAIPPKNQSSQLPQPAPIIIQLPPYPQPPAPQPPPRQ